MSTQHVSTHTTRVNTPHLDILAGPGDHLREELGVVGVEGVVGGLAAGQGRGLRGLLQDAHAVAEVVRLLPHNMTLELHASLSNLVSPH